MSVYRYHVVPFEVSISEKENSSNVAKQMQYMIDHYVNQGWEYMRLESVPVVIRPGCLSFSGAKEMHSPQMIFRAKK